jgi:transposase-like protein
VLTDVGPIPLEVPRDRAGKFDPSRDWRAVSISGGMVIVLHGELSKTIEVTERFASDLDMYAE